ncbi:hypothetical protein LEP1GSC150_3879, partial [Leptospira interrogans serovar Copenhageni str. LT2050]
MPKNARSILGIDSNFGKTIFDRMHIMFVRRMGIEKKMANLGCSFNLISPNV